MRKLGRRTFLIAGSTAAGGLLLSFWLPEKSASGPAVVSPFSPNAFLRIEPDDTVTITVPRPEMGQGVRTSLAMLVAEELDCDWEKVRLEQADLDPKKYGDQYVGGSGSIWDSWKPLREAGAAARHMLVQAAADQWKVKQEECRTESGSVVHTKSNRSLKYGALVSAAALLSVPKEVHLKEPSQRKLIGHRTLHVDTRDIVTGRIGFGIDTRVPGMLFAIIERSPVLGGRVAGYDDSKAKALPGVHAMVPIHAETYPDFGENSPKMPSGVAVVAASTWEAMRGREALSVKWDDGSGVTASTQQMREEAQKRVSQPGRWTYRLDGNPEQALGKAVKMIEAVYELPLLAHATMEPMNATAHVTAQHAEIWAPTQNPDDARNVVQKVTGLPLQSITIHPRRMGGGFGRRFYNDYVAEAAIVSKAVGAPVQVLWTREDDFRHGFYRPAGYYLLRGGLDSESKLLVWTEHLVNASRGHFMKWQPPPGKELQPGEIGLYDYPAGFIPHLRLEYTPIDSPIPRGQWRAVEESSNVFVIQGFLAELANAAGKDPLQFQLELIGEPRSIKYYDGTYDSGRLKTVFELAAESAGWKSPLPAGWGRGVAGSYSNGAYVAQVAEVEVMNAGQFRVHRIVAAVDCGTVVNLSGAEGQVQGGILFALSAALKQEITVEKGQTVQSNFDTFPVLRMEEAPKIEVHFVPSDAPPHGMGEGAVGQTAPAVAGAIFQATGKRIRRLPIRPEDLV